MGLGLKRTECQKMAKARLDDAIVLLGYKRFSGAYYLGGYAVEIGLKACIARQIAPDTIPDKSFIEATHSHELRKLATTAGLAQELHDQQKADQDFAANWAIAAEWKPSTRYEPIDSYSAQLLLDAIIDPASGVFEWIKKHW